MAAVNLIKRTEEQAPLTRFRRKLAENIEEYSMYAASRCPVLPISFEEQPDLATNLHIQYTYKRWRLTLAFSLSLFLNFFPPSAVFLFRLFKVVTLSGV